MAPPLLNDFDPHNAEHMDKIMLLFTEAVAMFFKVTITLEQAPIARELIARSLMRKRHTIVISCARQIGKTEIVCYVVWFLAYMFRGFTNESFRCIITAPERTTGSEVFDRTKKLFDKVETLLPNDFKFKQKSLDVIVLPDETKVDTFGLFKGFARRDEKKTTKEGRSCHMLIRDEMHLGDDTIFKDELEPALSTTGGIDVWIGNGGYRNCRAKQLCETVSTGDVTVFKLDFARMKASMQREFDRTQNPMFLRWIDSQQKYIDDYGLESDEVQKNLFLKWMVEFGNFISWENLISHRRMTDPGFLSTIADCGLDFAKEHDDTVLTIVDYERNIRDWQVFKGELPDQVEEIVQWLPEAAAHNGVSLRFLYCDSTGVGDPLKTMLRRRLRQPVVRGVVFNVQSKDAMAKKMLNAFHAKDERHRLTYPFHHPLRPKFEDQFRKLLRDRRSTGQLNFKHPDEHNAKDDYPDSLALALWNIERIRGLETGQDDDKD